MSESDTPMDEPFWVRTLRALVYSAIGFILPLTWAVVVAVLNQHTETGTEQAAEAFNLVGNFMGITGLVCFTLVAIEFLGPHYVNWKLRKLASELRAYLSGVTSG